ncbi:hypothetical protein GCM10023324_29870 [Streptomyces youssoufiensis]
MHGAAVARPRAPGVPRGARRAGRAPFRGPGTDTGRGAKGGTARAPLAGGVDRAPGRVGAHAARPPTRAGAMQRFCGPTTPENLG